MCYNFGLRVKNLRIENAKTHGKKNWTLNALAERIGVSSQSLSLIERGKTENPNLDIIKKLALDFQVSTDYLIFGENHKQNTLILEIPCSEYINLSNLKIKVNKD